MNLGNLVPKISLVDTFKGYEFGKYSFHFEEKDNFVLVDWR